MQTGWVIAIVGMAVLAIVDIREKAIPSILLIIFGMMAAIYAVMQGNGEWITVFYSLLPGAFLLLVSLCTRESVGYGDGWAVMALGGLIGMEGCIMTVCTGLVLSAVFSLILLVLHKVNGKSRLPFLPFLTVGLGVWMYAQKGF